MDPMTIASLLSSIASVGGGISGIMGSDKPQSYKDARDALRRQQEYTEASVNPNHPWFQALSAIIRNQLQRQAARGISEDMLQRRRAISAGNLPAGIDASRRDEARSKAITQAFMDAKTQGNLMAQKSLSNAAGYPSASNVQGYSGLINMEQDLKDQKTGNIINFGQAAPFSIENIIDIIGKMFGGSAVDKYGVGSYGSDSRLSGTSPLGGMLRSSYTGMLGGGV